MNTLNFAAHPTPTSPNILTPEQVRFLNMLVDTKFFLNMGQGYFDKFLSLYGTRFEEFRNGYVSKNFHKFIINVLRQGRYGNQSDNKKLKFIRAMYIYSKK
jgi:hypothetical protein